MDNQHRKITGYRELSQEEIDLMNEIKALGPVIEAMLTKISVHVENQIDYANGLIYDPEMGRKVAYAYSQEPEFVKARDHLKNATPERFIALAKTDFQTALMYLTRAVAQPEFF